METEARNSAPDASAENIYPKPISQIQADQNSPEQSFTNITPYKIPWVKVALLGAVLELGVTVLLGVFSVSLSAAFAATLIFPSLDILYLSAHVLAAFTAYRILKKWMLDYPFAIVAFSFLALFSLLEILAKKMPDTSIKILLGYKLSNTERFFDNNPGLTLLLILLASVSLFVFFTFLTNTLRLKRSFLCALSVPFICLSIFALAVKSIEVKPKNVSELPGGSIMPRYIPPGVVDGSGTDTCANQTVSGSGYVCVYHFDHYPGYLSASSQKIISDTLLSLDNKTYKGHFEPQSMFTVAIFPDDPLFTQYKFHDQACDLSGLGSLRLAGLEFREKAAIRTPAKSKRCVQTKTPGGRTLYYESYLNYAKDTIQVPTSYYFEQAGNLVTIRVGDGAYTTDRATSVYLTDVNFQNEFYKFIDGIN